MTAGRSLPITDRRDLAHAAPPSAPRYRLRAGYASLSRIDGRDRTRRDRDRLGAGDTATERRTGADGSPLIAAAGDQRRGEPRA